MRSKDFNAKIHELTIKLYGVHRAYIPLGFSNSINKILQAKMERYENELKKLGATIETTTDGIGKFPSVKDLDENILPYNMGIMECEKINSLISENPKGFEESY